MSNVQISEELKQLIDRQVAEGYAGSAIEYLEAAVRFYAQELEAGDSALVEAAERGLAALREGDFVTVVGPAAQRTFWQGVGEEAGCRLAAMRATTGDTEHHQPPDRSETT